ncbi:MAG: ribosome recycling factor [Planctomycetes bacterium]|nr:ribosome recycling factor [Planctomycetota bacterium]
MPTKEIVATHETSMKKCIEHFQAELKSIRTGRASTGLVDHVRVDYYGSPTPLNQLATISTPDPASIVIKPFDPASIKEIVKALTTSDLNMPPIADGKIVRLSVPPLSEERRKQIVGQVKQTGEQTKVTIRNIRRDGNKHLDEEQKNKLISEDDRDRGKRDIDDLTKKYVGKADEIVKAKSEDIMND